MSDFKTRLMEERSTLLSRSTKLAEFLLSDKTEKVDSEQIDLMTIQLGAMSAYLGCLDSRIKKLEDNAK